MVYGLKTVGPRIAEEGISSKAERKVLALEKFLQNTHYSRTTSTCGN